MRGMTREALCDVVAACERAVVRLNASEAEAAPPPARFLWLDMLCASQNLLAGKYENLKRFPKGTPGHAARKEDTDRIFEDAFESDACIYYVMTYASSGDLTLWIDRFTPDAARCTITEMLLALEYLHSELVVYRDVKVSAGRFASPSATPTTSFYRPDGPHS